MRIQLSHEDAINILRKHGGDFTPQPGDPPPTDFVDVDVSLSLTKDGLDEIATAVRDALHSSLGDAINPIPGTPGWPPP